MTGTPSQRAPRFSVRLCRLALRRALTPGVLLWVVLLALALASNDWSAGVIAPDVRGDPLLFDAWCDGLTRQGLWSGFCLALLPLLVIRAAGIVGRWRSKGEVDWLGSRACGPLAIAASTACGTLLAAWILVLAWWALVAMCVPGDIASLQLAGSLPAPGAVWVDGAHARAWTVELPPETRGAHGRGARIRVELGLGAGAGPATEVVLRALSAGATTIGRAHIGTRGSVEVSLPASAAAVELELSVSDPAARVLVLSDSAELWVPVAYGGTADRAIALRAALALIGWLFLALGLGAWVSAPSAALGVLALWIGAWLAQRPCAWIPGVDLPDALGTVAHGRVPRELDPRAFAGAIVALVTGLALAATGLARWRRVT